MAIVANPSVSALYEDALVYETGTAITSSGALTAYSGSKTGRSPLDKRIVQEESSEKDIWWGPVNKPMTPEVSQLPLLRIQSPLPSMSLLRRCPETPLNFNLLLRAKRVFALGVRLVIRDWTSPFPRIDLRMDQDHMSADIRRKQSPSSSVAPRCVHQPLPAQ